MSRLLGMKMFKGETLREALTPPHPEQSNSKVTAPKNVLCFQFNFTQDYNI